MEWNKIWKYKIYLTNLNILNLLFLNMFNILNLLIIIKILILSKYNIKIKKVLKFSNKSKVL